MRALVFSMLAMAAMVSCTSESDPINEVDGNGKVEIVMNAGILKSKAAVESDIDGKPTTDLNVSFIRATDGETASWSDLTSNSAISAKIVKAQTNISEISPTQYYNTDAAKNTHLIGYYPAATIAANKLSWIIDGTKDILIAPVQEGNKSKTEAISFAFAHQLTQLQFKVQAEKNNNAGKLISIQVNDVKTTANYTPSSATFSFEERKGNLSTEDPNTTDNIPALTGSEPETVTPIAGGNIMLEASSSPVAYSITLTTDKGAFTGTVTVPSLVSTAYEVVLTVKQQSISGSATVGEWKKGDSTSGDVI